MKRQNGSMALGFVTSRLRRGGRGHDRRGQPARGRHHAPGLRRLGADAASLTVTANALVDVRNWTFLFGPGLMPVFNAILFGTLLYRSRLVPRLIPTVGLIGAPLLFAAFSPTSSVPSTRSRRPRSS